MATNDTDAGDALLAAIKRKAEGDKHTSAELLRLAEAYAWVIAPRQPHGSQQAPTRE